MVERQLTLGRDPDEEHLALELCTREFDVLTESGVLKVGTVTELSVGKRRLTIKVGTDKIRKSAKPRAGRGSPRSEVRGTAKCSAGKACGSVEPSRGEVRWVF